MKLLKNLFFLPLFFFGFNSHAQKYVSKYDVLQENLVLKNGEFEFELVQPLDPNQFVKGKYEIVGDTLIFNRGIEQNKIIVKNCVRQFNTKDEEKKLMFIDENGKPLTYFDASINDKRVSASNKGLIKLKNEFPKKIDISILPLSDRLWACPYQQNYFEVKLKCKGKGNGLMITQLDLSNDFKIPFEHETKLLQKKDTLFYILPSGRINKYLYFKLDTSNAKKEEQKVEEPLTPENVFSGRELYDFSNYFNQSLIDTFLLKFKDNNVAFLHKMSSDLMKEQQSLEDFKKYLSLANELYGTINSYEKIKYSVRSNPFVKENNMLAQAEFNVNYSKLKGKLSMSFSIINRDTIKLFGFGFSVDDYTNIPKVNEITAEIFQSIESKNTKELYSLASDRFRDYTSIGNFESFVEELYKLDFTNVKLYKVQIGVTQNKEVINALYDLENTDKYFVLSLTKFGDSYFLEKMNLIPKK